MNIPRPMKMRCDRPKGQFLERLSAALIGYGYTINFSSPETGTLQAQYDAGSGFMVIESKRTVSVSLSRDTAIVNIRTEERTSGGGVSVQTWDTERAKGETLVWVREIMDAVQVICESSPITPGG